MSGNDEKRTEETEEALFHNRKPDEKTYDPNVVINHVQTPEEKVLLKIFDRNIIPALWLMYLVSSADRANVGLALTMNVEAHHGLAATVGINSVQVSLGIALFYVGYTIFEIPSNLIITRLKPGVWLARICITWGIITALYAVINNLASFLILRMLLGIAEAGLWPGMAYYLTKWYRKSEIPGRIALYYFASPFSGIVTGFISAGVQLIDGAGDLYAWKWLFIIFGIATVLIGILVLFWLPPNPAESGRWLTPEQKEFATQRLLLETHEDPLWTIHDLLRQFTDYKVYLFSVLYLAPIMVSTSLQYYLPTILKELLLTTYGPSKVNGIIISLLAIPPNVMVIVGAVLITLLSDKYKQRALGIIVFQILAILGLVLLTFGGSLGARYAGALITGLGLGPLIPLSIGWTTNSKDGSVNIAAATAIVSSIGQIGAIISTYALYAGWPSDAPQFIGSNMVNVGLSGMGIIAAILLKLDFIRLNKQIDERGETDDGRKIKYLH